MYIIGSDIARWVVVIAATWLAFALVRLMWLRIQRGPSFPAPKPSSIAGTVLIMVLVISRRMTTLGDPGDFYLWASCAAVGLLMHGVLSTYTFRPARLSLPRRGDTRRDGKAF